ncbi:hypothetical protein EWM64_g8532 [Hericium alpestre]|uniref:Uncharacterized protein n=1 Tax=Hericium alpestre TaxID=135208 RepID=A0A4Y9ZMK9_9AGAM|nr:hypothetical protein EWM64_g8532 [Hericium alpestre]
MSAPRASTADVKFWLTAGRSRLVHLDGVTIRSDASTVKDARQTLDNEMDAINVLLSSMGERRNALSPISCLHVEILSRIFMILSEEDRPSLSDVHWRIGGNRKKEDSGGNLDMGWLKITHVCHHWRVVALDNGMLWAHVVFDLGQNWTTEFLTRARHFPLTIHMHDVHGAPVANGGQCFQDIISQHLYHTKELAFSSRGYIVRPPGRPMADPMLSVIAALSKPAPVLESISVHSIIPRPVNMVSNLFDHQAPRLRRLDLQYCTISWPLPEFQKLVHLAITCNSSSPTAQDAIMPSEIAQDVAAFRQFWFSLERMPLLETLVLEWCIHCGQRPIKT